MPGDTIRYDIKEVSNDNTVALTDFFWRDVLPEGADDMPDLIYGRAEFGIAGFKVFCFLFAILEVHHYFLSRTSAEKPRP
ncbi:MAG: hypothetical protein LBR98_01205 [Syntrophomonadaceae bacterium]|jgi:uncharacterized repeat protein (TIGR01451 family)|nr:hypothetical protein [Syntrophomonadaceae bacterium]